MSLLSDSTSCLCVFVVENSDDLYVEMISLVLFLCCGVCSLCVIFDIVGVAVI